MATKLKIIPPPCLGCGKPLRRYRFRRFAMQLAADKANLIAADLKAEGKVGVLGYLKDAEQYQKIADSTSPDAQWGASGDNYFCKDGCAYKYAVAHLKTLPLVMIERARAIARAAYGAERVGGKLVKE